MQPEKSRPFAAATVLLRSERATLYRESMAEIAGEAGPADLDWDDELEEDPEAWERSGSSSSAP